MRRKAQRRHGGATGGQGLTLEQLAKIGAIAISWNDLELLIDIAFGYCIGSPLNIDLEISTNLSPHTKIEILKRALIKRFMIVGANALLDITFNSVKEHKRFRDGVIHARVADPQLGIGELIGRDAKIEEVLLSLQALTLLHERLICLREEMRTIVSLYNLFDALDNFAIRGTPDTEKIEQDIDFCIGRLEEQQKKRSNLAPLPNFPT